MGTHATIPAIPGLLASHPLTHIEALELDRVPEHLLVLGGGYVGLELAQAMRRFGSRVTVIDRNSRLAHQEDEDVSAGLHQLFHEEEIVLCLNATLTRIEGTSGQSVKVHVTRGGSEELLEGTDLLVATGRTPNTDGLGRAPLVDRRPLVCGVDWLWQATILPARRQTSLRAPRAKSDGLEPRRAERYRVGRRASQFGQRP